MSLKIENLKKSYTKHDALKGINIEINNGVFGLLGPNGAGKTTLMKCVSTLINDFTGEIKYNEINWNSSKDKDVKSLIGYLPQKFNMYGNLTVFEALEHIQIMKIGKYNKNELDEIISKVNLTAETKKRVKQLSGGMLRRLGIAQAIIGKPKILIIDEPTAGLDPLERIRFRSLLSSFSNENIIIISTHIVEDLDAIANNIAFIKEGLILKSGKPNDIIDEMSNTVFEIMIENKNLEESLKKYKVISVKSEGSLNRVKVLSETKVGELISPTLEDAYFKYIGVSYDTTNS